MPRNSDEEPDFDDEDYPTLDEVIERLEISENNQSLEEEDENS